MGSSVCKFSDRAIITNDFSFPTFGHTGSVIGATTTEAYILGVQARLMFNGQINQGEITLRGMSVATTSAQGATFSFYYGCEPTSAQWAYEDETESIAFWDTFGTLCSPRTPIYSVTIGDSGEAYVDLTPLTLHLDPGQTLVVGVAIVSGASSNVYMSLVWTEEQ